MADLAADLREFFDLEKRQRLEAFQKPDEFTRFMFCEKTGIAPSQARVILDGKVKKGELAVRKGRDHQGKPVLLYRVVKKK